MEDKIRINVSAKTFETLNKDMVSFEFFKKNGETNTNAFINQLIVNFHDEFSERQQSQLNVIKSNGIDEDTAWKIMDGLHKEENANPDNLKETISFRATKDSVGTIDTIESCELRGMSRSNYYRTMFEDYCSLSQDKRERIIFAELVNTINSAIENNRKLFLETKENEATKRAGRLISPYAITQSKEELYNYLLAQEHEYERAKTYRLCHIRNLKVRTEKANISEKAKITMDRMQRNAPQFYYLDEEDGQVIVEFNEKGLKKYKKSYIHRPVPILIEDNRYTFDCSWSQAENYFSRFGEDATIIYPQKLRSRLYWFHKNAMNSYSWNSSKKNTKKTES